MQQFLQTIDWKDGLGILGSFLIAGAYFGVSSGRLNGERVPFQLFNLAGACLILFSLYFRPNPGAIMIEVLWVGIALWSLFAIWRRN
jgi:hypothetical protein